MLKKTNRLSEEILGKISVAVSHFQSFFSIYDLSPKQTIHIFIQSVMISPSRNIRLLNIEGLLCNQNVFRKKSEIILSFNHSLTASLCVIWIVTSIDIKSVKDASFNSYTLYCLIYDIGCVLYM